MRPVLILILALALTLAGAACSSSSSSTPEPSTPTPTVEIPDPLPTVTISDSPTPDDFVLYTSEENTFQIALPPEWEIQMEQEKGLSAALPTSSGAAPASLQVIGGRPIEPGLSLDDLARRHVVGLESSIDDFQLNAIGRAENNGQLALLLDFEGVDRSLVNLNPDLEDKPFRLLTLSLPTSGDTFWTVSCISPADVYDQYEGDYRHVLASFRLLGDT